jgi:hypothetical protein
MSGKWWLCLGTVLCWGAAGLCAEEAVDLGISRFLAGDLQGAATVWSGALEANPADPRARTLLGNCQALIAGQCAAVQDYGAGCAAYGQAAELMPERNDYRLMAFYAELENACPTGDALPAVAGARPADAIFDVIFAAPPAAAAPEEQLVIPQGKYVIHTVGHGETLATIAQQYYNLVDQWRRIWKSNPQLKNPHRLFPGTKLVIPLD